MSSLNFFCLFLLPLVSLPVPNLPAGTGELVLGAPKSSFHQAELNWVPHSLLKGKNTPTLTVFGNSAEVT